MKDYADFIASKSQYGEQSGFEPVWVPEFLIDFQQALDVWAIRKGRAEIAADCGLGKTPMQLVWAENVVRYTNKPTLVLCPLAVAAQTVREGEKFGIECVRSKDGKFPSGARVVVANYDRLHYFDPNDFAGVVCDESGCIKDFNAATTAQVTEFLRTIQYPLLCTATPAPNDYVELGTSAEALGELGFQDMATKFFKKGNQGGQYGWHREKYQLKAHAEHDFWRWVCSWMRACRKPSDLGFDDGDFVLPPLNTSEHVVEARTLRPGFMFPLPAITLDEQREERRRTIQERCEKVAELVNGTGKPFVCWCHLNPEGDLLEKLIPDAVQVSGADKDEKKEELFQAFSSGQVRGMISKPEIAAWGLNWQHCAHETVFPSHSFEQYYQLIRRCWRFGQMVTVQVDMVTTEGERGVMANLQHKELAASVMFSKLVELMHDHLQIDRSNPFTEKAKAPAWLSTSSTKKSRKNTPSTTETVLR